MSEKYITVKVKLSYLKKILILILLGVLSYFITIGGLNVWYWKETSQKDVTFIITEHNGGQLCNQLWNCAHLYAYCREKNYDLFNLSFSKEYIPYFKHFVNNPTLKISLDKSSNCSSPIFAAKWQNYQHTFLNKYFFRWQKCNQIRSFNNYWFPLLPEYKANNRCTEKQEILHFPPGLEDNRYIYYVNGSMKTEKDTIFAKDLPSGYYCIRGWGFYAGPILEKYKEEIKELFCPGEKYQKNIDSFWQKIDLQRLVIAVHIRQGDFRYYAEGKHFFETSEYYKQMLELQRRYQAFRPLFIVFSNEAQNKTEFQNVECLIAQGNIIEDLYSMARCDVILGSSSSTYSGWAAWYGNSLLISMEDFSITLSKEFDHKVHDKMSSRITSNRTLVS